MNRLPDLDQRCTDSTGVQQVVEDAQDTVRVGDVVQFHRGDSQVEFG